MSLGINRNHSFKIIKYKFNNIWNTLAKRQWLNMNAPYKVIPLTETNEILYNKNLVSCAG